MWKKTANAASSKAAAYKYEIFLQRDIVDTKKHIV